jgi:DNA polymerase-3 subunit delta
MLPASLTNAPRAIYLLSSDEPLLLREWLDAARKSLQQQGFEEIISHSVEQGFDWDGLLQEGMSLSLFSSKKCHILRFASNRPGQVGAKFIAQLCAALAEDTVFILVMPKLDMAAKNSAWMKKISKAGEVCELKPVYSNQLPQWISQRAAAKGLQLDQQGAMLLADMTEGNLLATDQELEKLALQFEPGAVLGLEQIEQSISRSSRFTHYLLADACLAGQLKRAHKILHGLQQEGIVPVQILYALQGALEVLLQLKLAQQKGQLNANTWKALRVWSSKQRLYTQALSRLGYRQIEQCLRSCAQLDRINKGQQQPSYPGADWMALAFIVEQFSGLNTRQPVH